MKSSLNSSRVSRGSRFPHLAPVFAPPASPRFFAPVRFQPDSGSEATKRQEGKKKLTGPCVINIQGKKGASTKFSSLLDSRSSASLQTFMEGAADHFASITLPLGGKMTKIDKDHLLMIVPKIKIFDLWLQPSSRVKVT